MKFFPMLKILMLVGCALVFCILLLPSTTSPQESPTEFFFDSPGQVLGASESVIQPPTIKINNFSLPQDKNQPTFLIPVRLKGSPDFALAQGQGYLWHPESGTTLFSQAAEKQVPIASITKLATAITIIDTDIDWEKIYQVKTVDMVATGQKYVYPGDKVKIRDLFYLSLIGSANSATRALVRATQVSETEFIKLINQKVQDLGLKNTALVDPIGLSVHNVSTANELARLVKAALTHERIQDAVQQKSYHYKPEGKAERVVYNTNQILNQANLGDITHQGGKTGFTELAGNCFIGKFTTADGEELISVVLGSRDKNTRFTQTEAMIRWADESYTWE